MGGGGKGRSGGQEGTGPRAGRSRAGAARGRTSSAPPAAYDVGRNGKGGGGGDERGFRWEEIIITIIINIIIDVNNTNNIFNIIIINTNIIVINIVINITIFTIINNLFNTNIIIIIPNKTCLVLKNLHAAR